MKVIWCLESLSKRCIFKIVRLKAWVTGKQGTKSPVRTDDRINVRPYALNFSSYAKSIILEKGGRVFRVLFMIYSESGNLDS